MADEKSLLELTRELIDLQMEKKKFNAETNTRIKEIQLLIKEAARDRQ
jgi:hypothetical protein